MIVAIIFICVACIVLIYGIWLTTRAKEKLAEGQTLISEAKSIKTKKFEEEEARIKSLKELETTLESKVTQLQTEQSDLFNTIGSLQRTKDSQAATIQEYLNERFKNCNDTYMANIEKAYKEAESAYDKKVSNLNDQFRETNNKLEKLKATLSAGLEAQLREQEKEKNISFYKLSVSEEDLHDIKAISAIVPMLRKPVILNKLIWTTYFQKQTTELCNRILGANKVCGIYKITDLETKQAYVGQSVKSAGEKLFLTTIRGLL